MAGDINLVIDAQDKASGVIRGVSSAVSTMAGTLGGLLINDVLGNIARGFSQMTGDALNAAASFQTLGIQFQGLIAVQMAADFDRAHMRTVTSQQIVNLNGKEQDSLAKLSDQYNDATFRIATMQESYAKLVEKGRDNTASAAEQAHNIAELGEKMESWKGTVDSLTAKQGSLVNVSHQVAGATKTVGEMMQEADKPAREFVDWISNFAVKSQFTVLSLSEMARDLISVGSEMGFTIDGTKRMITAMGS